MTDYYKMERHKGTFINKLSFSIFTVSLSNKIHVLIFVLFLCLNDDAFAQNPYLQFAFDIGNTSAGTIGKSIAKDAVGNRYITGTFTHTTDFDPGPGAQFLTAVSSSGTDIFVAKYNAAGDYQWAFSIGSINGDGGNAVFVDATGNIYITGIFAGTADFDPGPAVANLTAAPGFGDAFIAKYNSLGIYQWAFSIGSDTRDEGFSIAVDGLGNVYVTGEFGNSVDFDPGPGIANLTSMGVYDIFVAKYNNAGAYVSAFNIGSTAQSVGYALAIDATNNVYVTGRFYSTCDFDPGPGTANLTAAGAYDMFVVKYNAAGIYQWAFKVGSIAGDVGYGISLDAAANIYITGEYQFSVDFDPGPSNATLPTGGAFIAKYSNGGSYIWAIPFVASGSGGNIGRSISTDASGNVYATGEFFASADFNPGPGTTILTATALWDVYIAKFSTTGVFKWAFSIGGAGANAIDAGYGIAADDLDNVFVTGHFQGSADFDPGAGTTILTPFNGDMFVAKYAACQSLQPPAAISGNTTVCASSMNTYSIADVIGATSYTWLLPGGWTGTSTTSSINTTAGSTGGSISVFANNACGASSSRSILVSLNAAVIPSVSITANPIGPVCPGSIVTFTAVPTNGGSAPAYQWKLNGINVGSDSTTYSTTSIANGDIVSCTLTNLNSCSSTTTANSNNIIMTVTTAAAPSLTITSSGNNICPLQPVTFLATPVNVGSIPSFQWKLNGADVGSNSSTYVNNSLADGDRISCVMSTVTTCSSSPLVNSNIISMVIKPIPVILFNPSNPTIMSGSSVQLNATITGIISSYLWTPATGLNDPTILNPVASPAANTIYNLNVIGANGCVVDKKLNVSISTNIYIPNSFTPNGDTHNDIFRIAPGSSLVLKYFIVYDKYGNEVFKTTDVSKGWDGTYKGAKCSQGVYVYIIKGIDAKGEIFLNGSVILIR